MKLNYNPIVTTASSFTSPAIPTDTRLTATFAFSVVISAAANVTINYTEDDPYAGGTLNWTPVPGPTFPLTATGKVNLVGANAVLATAFQVVVTGNTGTVSIQGWQNVTSTT